MRRASVVALFVSVLIVLTGCRSGGGTTGAQGAEPAGGQPAAGSSSPAAPSVTFSPAAGARNVRMDRPVTVTAVRGKLAAVRVTTAKGTELAGELDAAGTTWTSSGVLAADTSYTVTATPDADAGTPQTATFRTLRPTRRASMTLNVGDGQVVGVGLPIVARFLSPVSNRDAVVKALTVTTTPQVEGAWRAMPDNQFMWRPKEYWPTGTKVHVRADVGAVEVAKGVWGQRTYTSDFTIGTRVINTVDLRKLTLTHQEDGQPAKVLPVTTGKSTPDGKLLTRGGIKVIMEKGEWVKMVGTDPQDAYDVKVQWAMRMTNSGEYLHARPDSERNRDFGVRNASHGCTGLSRANAKWLYDHSSVGDVVQYVNGKRPLDPWNGWSVWQLSYQQWSTTSGA